MARRRLATEPFPPLVRVLLLLAGIGASVTGVVAVFESGNDAGAAALVTTGVLLVVLAALGPFVESVKVAGVEVPFRRVEDALRDAAERRPEVRLGGADVSSALGRARSHAELLQGASVLWVDDRPGDNDAERRILTSLGMTVDIALDNDEARGKVRQRRYACVISDIARTGRDGTSPAEAGDALAGRSPVHPRLVYYVRKPEYPAPEGSLGITNRPDELLHHVVDAVELDRFPRPNVPGGPRSPGRGASADVPATPTASAAGG